MGMDMFNLGSTGQYGDPNQLQQLQYVLQTLLAANPSYLTSGIPNKILSQFVVGGGAEPTVKTPSYNVSAILILSFILIFNILFCMRYYKLVIFIFIF